MDGLNTIDRQNPVVADRGHAEVVRQLLTDIRPTRGRRQDFHDDMAGSGTTSCCRERGGPAPHDRPRLAVMPPFFCTRNQPDTCVAGAEQRAYVALRHRHRCARSPSALPETVSMAVTARREGWVWHSRSTP